MARNLESRTEGFAPELSGTERIHSNPEIFARYVEMAGINNPAFRQAVQGMPRDQQLQIGRKIAEYAQGIVQNSPQTRRMVSLGEMYDQIPSDEQIPEGKTAKQVIMERVYGMPGRQYPSINAIAGSRTSAADIRNEVGKTLGYTVRSAWPGLLAGGGWMLANKWYKGQIAKGLTGRAASAIFPSVSFFEKPLTYLSEIMPQKMAMRATKAGATELGLFSWNKVSTPLIYVIGAYVAYKALKSFMARRREKRMEDQERLAQMSRGLSLQNQMLQERMALA